MAFREVVPGERLPKGLLFGAWDHKSDQTYLGIRIPTFHRSTEWRYEQLRYVTDYYDLALCIRIRQSPTKKGKLPAIEFSSWRAPRNH